MSMPLSLGLRLNNAFFFRGRGIAVSLASLFFGDIQNSQYVPLIAEDF